MAVETVKGGTSVEFARAHRFGDRCTRCHREVVFEALAGLNPGRVVGGGERCRRGPQGRDAGVDGEPAEL